MVLNYKFQQFTELNIDDLYQILKLRSAVFVLEQQCPYQDLDDMDQQAWHLFGKDKSEVVVYARILTPNQLNQQNSSIGRVVVSDKHRDQQLGRELMQQAIVLTLEKFPAHPIKISAQTYLTEFYQSLGFVNTGYFYLEDDIPHQEMVYQA